MSKPASRRSAHGTADVVRRRLPLEHVEQARLEALHAERHARHAVRTEKRRDLRSDRLRVGLDRDLVRARKRGQQPLELRGLGERRRPAAEEHRLDVLREQRPLQLELREQRVDVRRVLPALPDDRDEVAVPAAVRAERQVHVEVPDVARHERFRSESRLSTARKASCGTSTPPTCFMRFLPFFCFSSSLRLREMSPP